MLTPFLVFSSLFAIAALDEPAWPDVTPVYYDAKTGTPPVTEKATNDFSRPIVADVRPVAGHPVVHINGEPFPFFGGLTYGGWKRPDKAPRLGNLPCNLVVIRCPQELWHPKLGEYDLDRLVRMAENVANYAPNAYYLWDLMVFPPKDFQEKFPGEMAKDSAGEIKPAAWCLSYSYSSKRALAEMQEMCEKAIRRLEASPFANRIVGYRYCSGYGPEWIGWPFLANDRAYDYSEPSRNAFLAYVKEHFPELKDPHVPTKAERMAIDRPNDILWDRFRHLDCYAYTEFAGWERANCALELGRHLRRTLQSLGRRKLVGTYYGYTCHGNYSGCNPTRCHTSLKWLLDNNRGTLDFLMSPQNYGPRSLGETTGDMKPFATLEAHGILPVIEDDTRTHCVEKGNPRQLDKWSVAKTPAQSVAMVARGASVAICRRMFPYFCEILSELEFDFPEMTEPGRRLASAVRRAVEVKAKRHAEVALVVSERSIAATPVVWHWESTGRTKQRYAEDGKVVREDEKIAVYHGEVYDYVYDRFARAGAPCDQLLAEDLQDHPGDYKLYVFLDLFRYDPDVLEAVRKIRARGATVLWLYAPGYLGGTESCSLACMKELTGIDFGEMSGAGIPGGVTMKEDGRFMGMRDGQVARLFHPLRPEETLGVYANGRPGLVRFTIDGGTTYFYGGWQMDQKFIMSVEDRAGVHRYCDTTDPVEANDRFFTLHARFPGVKRIRLPRKVAKVENLLTGETVATDTDAFEFNAKLHETYLFGF